MVERLKHLSINQPSIKIQEHIEETRDLSIKRMSSSYYEILQLPHTSYWEPRRGPSSKGLLHPKWQSFLILIIYFTIQRHKL